MYYVTDWTRRVDYDAMRSDRIRRVHEQMERHNLDAVLLFKAENVRYVSGFRGLWWPILRMSAATVLSRESPDPVCLVPRPDLEHRQATMYWIKPGNLLPMAPLEDEHLTAKGLPQITGALEKFGVTGRRIGIDAATMPVFEALRQALPKAELVDGDTALRDARIIKGEQEITCMRMACECVDAAFDATIKAVDVGRRECEIMGDSMRAFYSLGMEAWQCSSIVASGTNLEPICRFPTDRIVREGDLVFMDIGGCFNGMYAEITRTVVAGRPNPRQQQIYQAVHDALQSVLAVMKPNATGDDMCAAANAAYERHGLGEYVHLAALGHSIGTGGFEPPVIGPAVVSGGLVTLRPGMLLSIEPTLEVPGVPGGGCVRIEEEVVVTPTGVELLTHTRYDAKLMGW